MKPCTGNCHHAAQLEQRLADLQAANEAKDNTFGGMTHDAGRAPAPYLTGDHVTMRQDAQHQDAGVSDWGVILLVLAFIAAAVVFQAITLRPAPTPAPALTQTATTVHAAIYWCPLYGGDNCPPIAVIQPHRPPFPRARRSPWRVAAAGHGTSPHTPGEKRRSNATAGVWDHIAQCESSGRLHAVDREQFPDGTWQTVVGLYQLDLGWYHAAGINPYTATAAQQLTIAKHVLARQGWNAWPVCSYRAGAR